MSWSCSLQQHPIDYKQLYRKNTPNLPAINYANQTADTAFSMTANTFVTGFRVVSKLRPHVNFPAVTV